MVDRRSRRLLESNAGGGAVQLIWCSAPCQEFAAPMSRT